MTNTNTETKTALFFAYGTLRAGQRLHNWIADEIVSSVGVGTMTGARLFYGQGHRGYPYLVVTDQQSDKAVGEIYEVPLNDAIVAMLEMEQNAGYTIAEGVADVDGVEHTVIVCEWRRGYDEPVPNNDWCSVSRSDEGWW